MAGAAKRGARLFREPRDGAARLRSAARCEHRRPGHALWHVGGGERTVVEPERVARQYAAAAANQLVEQRLVERRQLAERVDGGGTQPCQLLVREPRQAPDVDRRQQARFIAGQDDQHACRLHQARGDRRHGSCRAHAGGRGHAEVARDLTPNIVK